MGKLLNRFLMMGGGGPITLMNWINPQSGVSKGIVCDTMTWESSGNIGMLMELDVKMNQSTHTAQGLVTDGGSSNINGLRTGGVNSLVFRDEFFTFTGLDLYDGEIHHIKVEKVSSTNTEITVDSFTPQSVNAGATFSFDTVAGAFASIQSTDGTISNFVFTTSGGDNFYTMAINDGTGATTISNDGTKADATISGTETTDYIWE